MSERRAGDFREVVRQLTGRLLAAARFHLGDAHEAEDLVQTALLKAWQNWDETGVRGAIEAWLFTVVRNLCVDHRRKKRAKPLGDETLEVARPGEAPSRLPEVQEAMRREEDLPPTRIPAVLGIALAGLTVFVVVLLVLSMDRS